MKVLICGAGKVGQGIAAYLSKEENDVTVIDSNDQLIAEINDTLDARGLTGHAASPDMLNQAECGSMDMVIAVTNSDEVNMMVCQVAHSLFGVPKKIARIRDQGYLKPEWANLFSRTHMPIDVIISPEVVIAEDIHQRLAVPGSTYVAPLADKQAYLLGVICAEDCPLLNTPLNQFDLLFPDLPFRIMAIIRDNKSILPTGEEQLDVGDEVYFVTKTQYLKRAMSVFGHNEDEARRLIIMGGGNIGYGLAKLLEARGRGVHIKIIEPQEARAVFLSENLPNVIVLQGDGLDHTLLEEASVKDAETFIAVSNDDENNILGSLLAKRAGCDRVVTLVNNDIYSPLIGPLGVDTIVSPRSIVVATIMQHVRRGRIKGIHNLRDGFAEIVEAEVTESASVAGKTIEEIGLPDDVRVALIQRDNEIYMPKLDFEIKKGDLMVVLASQARANDVERLFAVQVDLF